MQDRPYISKLCERRRGIGADGLILLEESATADFKMRIFNADGSEAEMCGNGIRCLIKFLAERGFNQKSYEIETLLRTLHVTLEGDEVSVKMGDPLEMALGQLLQVENQEIPFDYFDTGVPHAIIFVQDIEAIDLESIGPKIRHHPYFAPKGTNVNYAKVAKDGCVHVRTFERGVEAETLACGTGATATALAAAKKFGLASPVHVKVKSQDVLRIGFKHQGDKMIEIQMTGPACRVFSGHF